MTQAIAIRTMGDTALSGAIADSMIARENRRLRRQLHEAELMIDHLTDRIERNNAQKLRQYRAAPKPSALRRFWGLLVERVDEDVRA